MNQTMTFCLAMMLGTAAAGMNWLWVSSKAQPPRFVAIKSDVDAGEELNDRRLIAVPVPGDVAELKQSLVPYASRSILFGTRATRNYSAGDVILQRDIHPPEVTSQWDVIGPFRLISVGEKFSQDDQYAGRSGGNNVTIAVDANFDKKTRRLLNVIRPDKSAEDNQSTRKIIAVQVVPSRRSTKAPVQETAGNAVYQTVSLDGIANVPRVLLEGDMIRFVVPGRPQY